MNPLIHLADTGPCGGGNLLSFPTWYKYLPGVVDSHGGCTPQIIGINDIWLILAAVIEILLRLSTLIAIGYIIYGGFRYIKSQGEPDKTSEAQHTIINAVVGLFITILATVVINFVAGSFS